MLQTKIEFKIGFLLNYHFILTIFLFSAIPIFFLGCENGEAGTLTKVNSNVNEDYQYLTASNFPFEILSLKPKVGKAVKANNKVILSYELDMVNSYRNSLFISKIDVVDFEKEKVIASFDSNYLKVHLLRPGIRSFNEVLELKTSSFAAANLWLEIEEDAVPKNIFHRVSFNLEDRHGEMQASNIDLAMIEFPEQTDLKIGFPFNEGRWFYIANAHRDARLISEGNPTFPQRYAIDWAAITDNNTFEIDSSETIQAYKTYNQDLLAVADAKVVFVKDSIPDNNPFVNRMAVRITRETVGGNYVVLDIGNNIYAYYGHLVPGSIKVKEGEKISKGDVIGKLGNSGNSTGPHLHFHLETKSKYPLGGEGVPYQFEKYKQLAIYTDDEIESFFANSNAALPLSEKDEIRLNQLPVGNGVIEYLK